MLKMFTVYDSKADAYLNPFTMRTTGEAIRGFMTTLNDETTEMAKYPADFTLFEIATFDYKTGTITTDHKMTNLGNGLHLKGKGNLNEV